MPNDARTRRAVLERIERMREEIVETLADLVRIPSVNPKYPGQQYEAVVGGETRANERLAREYEALGAEIAWVEVEPRRRNLVGVLRGAGGGRSLLFNGHIDVVPVSQPAAWTSGDPFSGRVEGGRLYGRGACDMKSGLVAQLGAARALRAAGVRLRGDLILTSVVGEEAMDHLAGITPVARRFRADAAVVAEPTCPPSRLAIAPVTCGLLWVSVVVHGRLAHAAARRELVHAGGQGGAVGASAIDKALVVLAALRALEEEWGQTRSHPLYRPGHFTLHPGVIQGSPSSGPAPFAVADRCGIDWAIWYPPHGDPLQVRAEVEGRVRAACQLDPWLRQHPPEFNWRLSWPSSSVHTLHPISQTLAAAHVQATGCQPVVAGLPTVCDAAFLNHEGTPAVVYGPGDLVNAHAIDEYVEIEEMLDACKTYALAAMEWCGVA